MQSANQPGRLRDSSARSYSEHRGAAGPRPKQAFLEPLPPGWGSGRRSALPARFGRHKSVASYVDSESGYAKLVREWYLFRIPAQVAVVLTGLGLGLWWRWWSGLVIAGLAAIAFLETRVQLRRNDLSPFLSILLDTTLIGAGVYYAQVPYLAMPVPLLTTAVTAVLLLPLRRAVWVCGFVVMMLGAVVSSSVFLDRPPLAGTRGMVVGSLATFIFGGLVLRLVWMVQNVISEDHRLRQKVLEESVEANNHLVASVSHEIRTPLTAVLGFIKLLAEDRAALSDAEQAEMLQLVSEQAMDLSHLVEDLLAAARSGADALEVAEVQVNVRAEVAQVLEAWTDPAVDRITVEGGSARAIGEPARVRQILRNLVSNALRYGGDNIGVELRKDATNVYAMVWDDGDAIPVHQRERIFERYTRGAAEPTRPDSIGLGLPVSRDLARLMGGDLTHRYESGRNVFVLTLRAQLETAAQLLERESTQTHT